MGIFALLEAMQGRLEAGADELLNGDEASQVRNTLFKAVFCDRGEDLRPFLRQKLGSDWEDEAKSMLWEWFLKASANEEDPVPIWLKARRQLQHEPPDVRDPKAFSYLKTSARRWLKKRTRGTDAVFYERIMRALKDEAFVLCGGTGQAAAYTLRGRSDSPDPSFDAGRFGRRLPHRSFTNRSGDEGAAGRMPVRVPDTSDLRDALIDAMTRAQRAFTVDQAEAAMRWVFGVSHETNFEPLDGLRTEPPQTGSNSSLIDTIPDDVAGSLPSASSASDPDPFDEDLPFYFAKKAADAIVTEIERQDKLPAVERPQDTAKGRVARYMLDFELWDGWPLLWHPILESILAKVPKGKRKPDFFDSVYDLTLFEAWSGIPDSSVSDWRSRRRWELIALGFAAGLGWSKPKALNYVDPDRSPETRRNHPEAFRLLVRLLFHLRSRFLQRKPEFVSPAPFTQTREEFSEAS